MAATLSQLTDDYLFEARIAYPNDYNAQKDSLVIKYQLAVAARDGGDAEVTGSTFKSNTSQIQFRGATPEDHRLAIKAAIEQVEAIIAGETASQFNRPFAIRFVEGPSTTL